MVIKKKLSDYIGDFLIYAFMILLIILVLYPFLNSVAISFNNANDTSRGGIGLWPRVPTIQSYKRIFTNAAIYRAYFITIARTLIGTVAALFMTSIIAFGMAHEKLVFRRFYTIVCLIPMYFGGGLIPYYFLIRSMHLPNTFWVYIVPSLIGLFNIILMRTFFKEIPEALEESAHIDGANYLTVFMKIIIPISAPIIATVALFVGVGHWNDWFVATIFITTRQDLKPMQNILLSIINEASFAERIAAMAGGGTGAAGAAAGAVSAIAKGREANQRSITMATMIITIVPIVAIYPFLQRFFIKGIMVGSIKG